VTYADQKQLYLIMDNGIIADSRLLAAARERKELLLKQLYPQRCEAEHANDTKYCS
jgi:hypothetical protein